MKRNLESNKHQPKNLETNNDGGEKTYTMRLHKLLVCHPLLEIG